MLPLSINHGASFLRSAFSNPAFFDTKRCASMCLAVKGLTAAFMVRILQSWNCKYRDFAGGRLLQAP
jgi:hypothetical protein